jgi:hypothetical protein
MNVSGLKPAYIEIGKESTIIILLLLMIHEPTTPAP